MKILFSNNFRRAYKKLMRKSPETGIVLAEKIQIFLNNPNEQSLATHKLKGNLKHLWAFSLEYDLRIVFQYLNDSEVIFEDIGTHDEVY